MGSLKLFTEERRRFLDPEDTEACPEQMMRALRESTVRRDDDDVRRGIAA